MWLWRSGGGERAGTPSSRGGKVCCALTMATKPEQPTSLQRASITALPIDPQWLSSAPATAGVPGSGALMEANGRNGIAIATSASSTAKALRVFMTNNLDLQRERAVQSRGTGRVAAAGRYSVRPWEPASAWNDRKAFRVSRCKGLGKAPMSGCPPSTGLATRALLLASLALPAFAKEPVIEFSLTLLAYRFEPDTLTAVAGVSVVLTLVNPERITPHNFTLEQGSGGRFPWTWGRGRRRRYASLRPRRAPMCSTATPSSSGSRAIASAATAGVSACQAQGSIERFPAPPRGFSRMSGRP